MPTQSTKRSALKQNTAPHKKPRLDNAPKLKPARKGTPPPKLKSKLKPHPAEPRAVSFHEKLKAAKPKDTKGKAKAVALDIKDAEEPSVPRLPSTFKIIAGSYEKLLYGLEGSVSVEGSSRKFELKPVFMFPAHISSVKAVATSPNGGKWLATGSTDEIIKVWDLRRRKEIGGLMHHEGSITHLEFPSRSHLLSASEDGTLCLFHARDWTVLRTLKGHKGRVNSVAVHPSGKVALSVGKDRTLRMWDLMRGKGSASMKLGKEGELARWSSDGSLFVVQTLFTIDVYSTNMNLLHTIRHLSRLHDLKFCKRVGGQGEVLLVAGEDKKVTVYDVPADIQKVPTPIAYLVGHNNRVKAVDTLEIAIPATTSDSRTSTTVVSTISSDGKIRLYDLAVVPVAGQPELLDIEPVADYDTKGSRLTCMSLADGEVVLPASSNKRKRGGVDEERGEDLEAENDEEEWIPQHDSDEASGDEVESEAEGEGEVEAEDEDEEEED